MREVSGGQRPSPFTFSLLFLPSSLHLSFLYQIKSICFGSSFKPLAPTSRPSFCLSFRSSLLCSFHCLTAASAFCYSFGFLASVIGTVRTVWAERKNPTKKKKKEEGGRERPNEEGKGGGEEEDMGGAEAEVFCCGQKRLRA